MYAIHITEIKKNFEVSESYFSISLRKCLFSDIFPCDWVISDQFRGGRIEARRTPYRSRVK